MHISLISILSRKNFLKSLGEGFTGRAPGAGAGTVRPRAAGRSSGSKAEIPVREELDSQLS